MTEEKKIFVPAEKICKIYWTIPDCGFYDEEKACEGCPNFIQSNKE